MLQLDNILIAQAEKAEKAWLLHASTDLGFHDG